MGANFFDFKLQPGKELKEIKEYNKREPVISIIIPYYNDKKYIEQTINSVLNQTYPYYEIIIVDDGSEDEESLKKLEEIKKLDNRIAVFHKKNEGISATRDFGVSKSSESSKYLFFLDSDDLIEPTYLECAYWTLETNKEASWAYTDSVGFEGNEYCWNKWFDSQVMKTRNDLVATAMVRKKDFLKINGYELREKAVNEDWNFWLKMIANGFYPVRMNFYGFWYRRKVLEGELSRSKDNKERNMEIIKSTVKTIKKPVKAIQYPKQDYNWDVIEDNFTTILIPELVNKKDRINILMIIPWMVTGGADKFNIDFIKGLNKDKFEVTVITTEPQINDYRQSFEKFATVFDLSTFIDKKYWVSFINYIIKSRNINFILNTNSRFGYALLPYLKANYPEIPMIDYIHMEEWYNRNGGYSRDSSSLASILDKTLVCNKNSENILVENFKRNRDDIKTVYIGVDEEEYNPDIIESKESILKKYNIDNKDKFIIGYICRISAQKRPHLLIKIIQKLKEIRKDFLVIIAGDGEMLNAVKSEARKNGLNDFIKFVGNIKETKDIYAISDVTLNCSIKEGVALASYESLAMGVPVISSNVGGQGELINDEVGVIVPCMQKEEDIYDFNYKDEEINNYIDAINKVLGNLKNYKEKCRKRILNGFTINQMTENMSQIIECIFNNPKEEKIESGKGLSKNLLVTKELITLFFQENEKQYEWQCNQYNSHYFELKDSYRETKFSKIKEKLWTFKTYKIFIRFLQKTGLMKIIKKVLKRDN